MGLTESQDSLCAEATEFDGRTAWPFFLRRSTGRLETSLQHLSYVPTFQEEPARQELLSRIRGLPARTYNTAKTGGRPAFALEDVVNDSLWVPFTVLAADVLAGIRQA